MKHLQKKSLIIVLCLIIFLCFQGCKEKNKNQCVVKLAYIPYTADLPFFVALDKGFFKERGLNIEPIKCANSSEALDLVLAGKADGSMGNSFSVLFSIHEKDPNKIRLINVSVETRENDRYTGFILVRKDSGIKNIEGLKGKTVGTEKGASQLLWVELYFKKMGWDFKKDVYIEQEAPESLLNALHSGQFDAIFVFEPYATVGISKGLAKSLEPYFRGRIIDPFPAGGAVLSKDFIINNPDVSEKVIEGLDEAVEFINYKPEEAKLTLLKYTPLNKQEALDSKIYFWWGSKEMKIEPIQKLADILTVNKLLNKKIAIKDILVE